MGTWIFSETTVNSFKTSLNREIAFNQHDVNLFYDIWFLRNINFLQDAYNMDETRISGVHKPPRILAEKGRNQVGTIVNGERGQKTAVVCCMNVVMFRFKQKRIKIGLIDAALNEVGSQKN